jgi:hypothetical protein
MSLFRIRNGKQTEAISSASKVIMTESSQETVVSTVCVGEYPKEEPTSTWYDNETERHTWALTLGVAGLLDILATVLPGFVGKIGTCDDASTYDLCELRITAATTFSPEFLAFVDWIDQRNVAISLFFSTLWFMDAFLKASSARQRVLVKKEHQSLLVNGDIEQTRNWWDASTFVYYQSIAVQLLYLPVGFYFVFFYIVQKMVHGQGIRELGEVTTKKMTLIKNDDYIHYESFSVNSREAFLIAILEYVAYTAFGVTAGKFSRFKKIQTRKLIRKAIRHPRKFRRQVVKVLAWIRYVRYGIPLVGSINKLRANFQEMLTRRRQRREAQTVKRIRQLIWGKKSSELKEEEAAIMLQRAFRAHRAQKATRAMQILRADREYIAVAKIQHRLRRKLEEARRRLKQKREEVKRLEKLGQKGLSGIEKLRLYELQDELVNETKKLIDRKMLIRPNRSFVFYWKVIFLNCIIFEIGQKFVKSWVQIHAKKSDEGGIAEFVAHSFVPTRVSELPQCKVAGKEMSRGQNTCNDGNAVSAMLGRPWYCEEPFAASHEFFRDIVALVLIPAAVSDWPECKPSKWYQLSQKTKKPVPWYCDDRFHSGHAFYRHIANFFWEEFLVFIGVICFLDVFVTFFTGEFDPDNGILVPKPFFKRWIVPGLALQLLVNPQLGTVSSWTFDTVVKVLDNGPVRVYRWSATVAFPLVYLLVKLIVKKIWPQFAAYANQNRVYGTSQRSSESCWLPEDAT